MFPHHPVRSILLTLAVFAVTAAAQPSVNANNKSSAFPTFHSAVSEVRVTFFATDQDHHALAALSPSDFAIVDNDRVIRNFRSFNRSDETSLDVVVLVEMSESLAARFRATINDVLQLVAREQSIPADKSLDSLVWRFLRTCAARKLRRHAVDRRDLPRNELNDPPRPRNGHRLDAPNSRVARPAEKCRVETGLAPSCTARKRWLSMTRRAQGLVEHEREEPEFPEAADILRIQMLWEGPKFHSGRNRCGIRSGFQPLGECCKRKALSRNLFAAKSKAPSKGGLIDPFPAV
jgi:hypothetical protein